MRFSESLRFNANPDWWPYYLPYDELKKQVSTLSHIYSYICISLDSQPNRQANFPHDAHQDFSTDEEEQDLEQAVPHAYSLSQHPPMRRTASQRVLGQARFDKSRISYNSFLRNDQAMSVESRSTLSNMSPSALQAMFDERETFFFDTLHRNTSDIERFYCSLCEQLDIVTSEIRTEAQNLSLRMHSTQELEGSNSIEYVPLLASSPPLRSGHMSVVTKADLQDFRKRVVEHYKELGETINFSVLNHSGFDKILKKHDKHTARETRAKFMDSLKRNNFFMDTTSVKDLQCLTERIFADVFKNGDIEAGKMELHSSLRDLIIWDRNTIWRDILRTERRVAAFHSVKGGDNLVIPSSSAGVVLRPRLIPVFLAVIAFVVILMFPQFLERLPVEGGRIYAPSVIAAANRCLAMVTAVIILWAFDGLPLYVSSFLILPLTILLGIFLDEDGKALDARNASATMFSHLSSPTLILIVCVYALGAALSKFEIDKLVATSIISRVQRADHLLLTVMGLAVFVSMLVSNVAAPVLLNSVLMPTIDAMRESPHNRKYVQCLLLGVMVGSNIGGFASPISSPQSVVALGLLNGDYKILFFEWLKAALPQCALMVLASYGVLCVMFKPRNFKLPPVPRFSEKVLWPHWVVIVTILITVVLWSVHSLSNMFGSAGVVAVIPIIVLFGSGILTKEDFNNLPWDVVWLVAGGMVLGAAVESCELLSLVAERLTHQIGASNIRLTYVVLCAFMATIANAVSHTVSAIIVLPLIFKIGVSLEHPQLLVVGGTIAASCAMAFPISSFPNISAIQVEDETGNPYLTPQKILYVGSIMTVVATIILLTFGYQIMLFFGL